jgi:hypothetical protein
VDASGISGGSRFGRPAARRYRPTYASNVHRPTQDVRGQPFPRQAGVPPACIRGFPGGGRGVGSRTMGYPAGCDRGAASTRSFAPPPDRAPVVDRCRTDLPARNVDDTTSVSRSRGTWVVPADTVSRLRARTVEDIKVLMVARGTPHRAPCGGRPGRPCCGRRCRDGSAGCRRPRSSCSGRRHGGRSPQPEVARQRPDV